ncbi:type IV pilus twitching motility protein PilT [Chloroflexota bacterium]
MDISVLVQSAVDKGASDLHIVISSHPVIRIAGVLNTMTEYPLISADDVDTMLRQMASEQEIGHFEEQMELDFSYTLPGISRIRCNASKQNGTTSLVIRLVASDIPRLEELGLPEICKELVRRPRGLVVVSGPTGSGKSTTLSAMINYLNREESRRVVTVEDPVEYLYTNDKCIISQREVGKDTRSFNEALRHVLRQDPDVILVGEMRDTETAAAVLTIAETGHLVLTTGHATSAAKAVERIIDLFPLQERPLAQARLASFLNAVLCQILVPTIDGAERVAAMEVMLSCSAVNNTIREGRFHQLPNTIVTQARMGMISLDNALIKLYKNGIISRNSVAAFCNDPEEINKIMALS